MEAGGIMTYPPSWVGIDKILWCTGHAPRNLRSAILRRPGAGTRPRCIGLYRSIATASLCSANQMGIDQRSAKSGPRATARPATHHIRTARDKLVGPRAGQINFFLNFKFFSNFFLNFNFFQTFFKFNSLINW